MDNNILGFCKILLKSFTFVEEHQIEIDKIVSRLHNYNENSQLQHEQETHEFLRLFCSHNNNVILYESQDSVGTWNSLRRAGRMCAAQGGDDECEDGDNGMAATWMKLFARRWTRRWM